MDARRGAQLTGASSGLRRLGLRLILIAQAGCDGGLGELVGWWHSASWLLAWSRDGSAENGRHPHRRGPEIMAMQDRTLRIALMTEAFGRVAAIPGIDLGMAFLHTGFTAHPRRLKRGGGAS